MAMLRLNIKRFNAPRQGHMAKAQGRHVPADAHAQYILRQMPLDEHLKHALRERPSERQRDDLIASGSVHLPGWAQGDALAYWQAAQQYSQAGAVIAKELEVTLPRELTHAQNHVLIHAWLAKLPALPTTWAFHEPRARNGVDVQPHVHILVSPRQDDRQHTDPRSYFKRPDRGGVPTQQLWTQKGHWRQLWREWEQLLRATLKEHGLEQTLDRWHTVPEIALTWQEMKHLERLMRRTMPQHWGHEYRIPPRTLQTWQQQGVITLRQATWLAQRGQRQLTWQIVQEQPKVWGYTTQLAETKPWQVVAKRQALRGRQRVEATIQTLQHQRQQLSQVYMTWLAPAHRTERAQYAQRRARGRGVGRTQEPTRPGVGAGVALPTLDAALQARERQQERER